MATRGVGVATISFPASPQAAEYASATVVSDSAPNPNEWATSNLPASTNWPVVVYGGGRYVAACNIGNSAHSTDGINWDRSITQVLSIVCAAYGNGVFVGISSSTANTYTICSVNGGTTWTYNGTVLPSSAKWSSIAFGNGIFVAVSITASAAAATSSNGTTWSSATLPSAGNWYVGFGNGLFVAVKTSSATVATSTDGATWNETATLPSSQAWNSVCYGKGIFVASGSGGVSTSVDGVNWSPISFEAGSRANGSVFGGGRFLMVPSSGPVYTSLDGVTWLQEVIAPSFFFSTPCYGGGQFVLLGDGADYAHRLVDNVRTTSTVDTQIQPAKASPGANLATTTVTGLIGIASNSSASAFLLGSDSTSDHNAYEHEVINLELSCDNFVVDVGFDITATSTQRLEGDFKVRYVWGN